MLLAAMLAAPSVHTQSTIPAPQFTVGGKTYTAGDDYFLANYTHLQEYLARVDQASDRVKVVEFGKTAEGRPMLMAIITSPENHQKLARYKEIANRLARAEGLTDEEARKLAAEGKAVVWIDSGLHGTEVINAQGMFTFVHQMASQNDPETRRFLNDVVTLVVNVNPDGMELVSNWYMRQADEKQRSTAGLPVLYEKYAGHDNNRDSYMNNLPETEAVNRQLYIEWNPQIMYNQHQTGPAGTVLFAPPFRDPFNYNVDPLVPMGIDLVSTSIHNRFVTEGKPGATMRSGAGYSTWFNGGSRTTTGFHNMIGILTEIIGSPTPGVVSLVLDNQLPRQDLPMPIPPQTVWRQRQSIDYVMTVNRAILDVASKHREDFLYRLYKMGRNSIDRGSRDNWTVQPDWIDEAKAKAAGDAGPSAAAAAAGRGGGRGGADPKYYAAMLTPERRDPRGYILPSDQADFNTATRFVNALIKGGVDIHRATAPFTAAGKSYPAGSYVIKAAQAFRPHLRDMLEPQDHPNDFQYPGGPPRPPYDVTGYTLAYQMGVNVDRILDAFDGPFEKLARTPVALGGGTVGVPLKGPAAGYLLSHRLTDAFTATTRLLSAKEDVYWLKAPFAVGGRTFEAGTIYIPSKPTTKGVIDRLAAELGIAFTATTSKPAGEALKLNPVRIGLWDRVWRVDALGLDPLHLRANAPCEVRPRVPAGARCGEPRSEVRRAHLPRRRDPRCSRRDRRRARRRDGGTGGRGRARRDGRAVEHPCGVPGPPGPHHGRDHHPDAQEVRRGRRDHHRHRRLGEHRRAPGDPGWHRAGRTRERRGAAVAERQVLRAGVRVVDGRRSLPSAGVRVRCHGGRDVGEQPRAEAGPGRGAQRREGGRLVRFRHAAAQRMGVGPAVSEGAGHRARRELRQGQGVHLHAGDHLPRPAARDVQVPLQRNLLRQCEDRDIGKVARSQKPEARSQKPEK